MPAKVAFAGGGFAGCFIALAPATGGIAADLFGKLPVLVVGASLHNEGNLHLGYVYAADPKHKTRALLAQGSINFLDIWERLTGSPASDSRRPHPLA